MTNTPNQAEGLLPCPNPWCKTKNRPVLYPIRGFTKPLWAVCCPCGVQAPDGLSEAEAVTAWNTRSPSPGREEIAKVIDPWAFGPPLPNRYRARQLWALDHADRILSLFRSPRGGER
jgi:hypothetical protein